MSSAVLAAGGLAFVALVAWRVEVASARRRRVLQHLRTRAPEWLLGKDVADTCGVPRHEVYVILGSLEDAGLVARQNEEPTEANFEGYMLRPVYRAIIVEDEEGA